MNNIDDILERLKGQQPVISDPDELTDRIMDSLPDLDAAARQPVARVVKMRWLWTAAASLIIIIGIGTIWQFNHTTTPSQEIVAKAESTKIAKDATEAVTEAVKDVSEAITKQGLAQQSKATPNQVPLSSQPTSRYTEPEPESPSVVIDEDPNVHYAAQELTKDTIPYQDPARVDDFIAKLADYNKVKEGGLTCTATKDSSVVSAVYVFPDKDEINVFGRLLQVACWYDSKTPGYHLNFSQQQFFFELKDLRQQLQYRWIAERINGRILFYGTHAPLGTKESSACYQQYRDELMYQNSFNTKTKKL